MTTPDLFDSPSAPQPIPKGPTLREYIKMLQEIADDDPTALDLHVMKWLPSSGAVPANEPKIAQLTKVVLLGQEPRVVPRFWHPSDGLDKMGPCVVRI